MPGEWQTKALGDVALFEMGQAPSSRFVSDNGPGYPFLQGNAEFGARNPTARLVCSQPTKLSQENDVLISVRAPVGEVNISNRSYAIGRGLAAIRFIHLDPNFGWHAVKFAAPELDKVAQGSTFAAVGKTELSRLRVPCPPLPEQRRIAAILDTLDRTIKGTQRVIEKLQATRQGLLHDLLTRGLDENGQLRDPERNPEQFKETELGRVPRGWEVTRLLDHVELPSGQVDPKQDPYRSMPLIAADHIESRTGRLLNVATAEQQGAISGKYVFRSGDVLYSKIRPNLRKATLANFDGICSADMYPLQSKPTMSPEYLIILVLGERFSKFAEAVSMRSGFPKINREELSEYYLVLPQLDEQQQIATKVGGVDNRIAAEQAQLAKLQALKRGLMEDLLTGRVRVPLLAGGVEDSHAAPVVRPYEAAEDTPPIPIVPPPLLTAAQPRALYRAGAGANPQAMTEWTRQLQEAVRGQQVGTYSHAALDAVLPELLALSADRGGLLRVPELLARAGIRFMLLPHPRGSRTSGAAFYLDEPERTQPVVGLSLLNPYLDVFWFNLLHELGHIRLGHEPVPDESLEQGEYDPNSADEQAANTFARTRLIPEAKWQPFLAAGLHDSNRIKRFAGKLGRHPAIVAGRLGRETGNWERFNGPRLRPTVRAELDELMAQLRGAR